MNIQPKDMTDVRVLRAVGHGDFRDASTNGAPWRRPATNIPTPGDSAPHRNPISKRMATTRTRNPTARMTPGNSRKESQASTRPLASSASRYFSPSTFGKDTVPRGRKRAKLDHTSIDVFQEKEPIIVLDDDEEEDAGKPIQRPSRSSTSPDPLAIGPSARHNHSGRPPATDHQDQSSRQRPSLCPEGEITRRVMASNRNHNAEGQHEEEDSDSIHSASGFDSRTTNAGKQRRISGTPSRVTSFPNVQTKIQMFDLKEMERERKKKPAQTIKNSMKPRSQAQMLNYTTVKSDPTTEPTNYKHVPQSFKPSTSKKSPMRLPLAAWVVGFKPSPSIQPSSQRFHLCWNERSKEAIIKDELSPDAVVFGFKFSKVAFKKIISMLINTQIHTSEPMVQFESTSSMSCFGRLSDEFKPGERHQDVSLKFMAAHSRWDSSNYAHFFEQLKICDELEIIRPAAAVALWSTLEDTLEFNARDDERQEKAESKASSAQASRLRPSLSARRSAKSRSSPSTNKDSNNTPGVRHSTRLSGHEDMAAALSPVPDADEVILVYPLTGPGAVNITNAELGRLRPLEFLNDTLIEFGLKLWLNDLRETRPELADQIHVFSSFFYKKISTKNPEEGYHSVRKWTSKIDLFQKKYIIVPINEHLHWYLAIICNPEYVLAPPPPKIDAPVRRSGRKSAPEAEETRPLSPSIPPTESYRSSVTQDIPLTRSRSPSQVPESVVSEPDVGEENTVEDMVSMPNRQGKVEESDKSDVADQPMSVVDVEDDNDDDNLSLQYPSSPVNKTEALSTEPPTIVPQSDDVVRPVTVTSSSIPPATFYGKSNKAKGKQKARPSNEITDVDGEISRESIYISDTEESVPKHPRTQIYTFDSLGSNHPQAIRRLGNYLQMEAADKKGIPKEQITPAEGRAAQVPIQQNYCDCGVYLLHFVKSFMKDPELSVKIIESHKPSALKRKRVKVDPHEHWEGDVIKKYREELMGRVKMLSESWKKMRAEREEQKKKESAERETSGEKATPAVSGHDSDSDIVMEEPEIKPPAKARGSKALRLR
ncbi:hypothetical protein EVG20_g175 [Dentipellis fragilis]|uniref:Ubiquitin-like protease family profile domain-containing protein n=1 Tax=Dentipellis fragilis TaxID=205917 RepID=A0A4Y9ZEF0_9AGAM|nr:hypothetical protein EVG20_g175 [Dentipellis fragilis]